LGGAPSGAIASAGRGGASFFDFGMLFRCFSRGCYPLARGRVKQGMARADGPATRAFYGWAIVAGRVNWRIRSPRVVLGLLTVLNLVNYVDRSVLPAVIAPVQDDLHLSNFVAGLLSNLFLIGYSLTSPIFGIRGDRATAAGRNRLIALGVAVWSLATIGSGLAAGAGSLIVARALVGVGEASYATLAPTLIDEVAPPARAGAWMAVFSSATPVGSALGYVVGGAILHAHGWRAAFFVAGGPGLVAAILCLFVATPAGAAPRRQPHPVDLFATAKALMREPLYRRTVLGYCAYTFAVGGFGYWAPKYLHLRYGLEPGRAAMQFGLFTVAGGLAGTLLGGWAADRAVRAEERRDREALGRPLAERKLDVAVTRGNLVTCAVATAIGAPLAALAIAAPTSAGFFAALIPCETALFALSGPINVAILRSAPPAMRASAMALAIFAIHALGDFWSPPLIGIVADHAPMGLALAAAPIVFALAALTWWGARRSASVGLT
jgi:MFS family permease